MVFADVMGIAEATRRVKIYATDIDLDALAQARVGVYSERSTSEIPENFRNAYLAPDPHNRGLAIVPPLRRTVVFGRLDLTRDPPISRVDLLACRNTLMYLNAETQSFVIPRLHYALREGGYLFLGRAEMVLRGGAGRFSPVSLRHRIFVTMPHLLPTRQHAQVSPDRRPFDVAPLDISERAYAGDVRFLGMDTGVDSLAELLVDTDGLLVGTNDFAADVLGITGADVRRPFAELPIASRPVDLVEPVSQVLADARSNDLGVIAYKLADGTSLEFEVRILPVLDENGNATRAAVTLADVRTTARLREGYRQMHEELETAYEELQSTNEELVTSNEELQSSYEELETSNEELQSANEELETTNEELRSSNEELETTNLDLKVSTEAVEQLNTTLVEANRELMRFSGLHRQVMDSLPAAVIVLTSHLLIEEWNRAAAGLWGLEEAEVLGEPFFGVDFGLPLERLQDPVRACRAPGALPVALVLEAVNAAGETFTCRVQVLPTSGGQPETAAMLIMEVVSDAAP
jgi:two-component system CheB/CheR fusion protein